MTAVRQRARALLVLAFVALCFAAVAAQLLRLALKAGPQLRAAAAGPLVQSWSRPDIVDRRGGLIATDVAVHSLFADPYLVLDADEAAEKLTGVLSGLDARELRRTLADKSRRFAWIARALSPRQAQRVHELGLPGLAFRMELRRAYPLGALTGHIVGAVDVDNRGLSGIERMLDDAGAAHRVPAAQRSRRPPVRLSLDIGVQHALAAELKRALARYRAAGAAGLVMDVRTGEIVAAVSLPELDPDRPAELLDPARLDRLLAGTFELGSVYKILTVAMALELGIAHLDSLYDVRQPLHAGPHTIRDPYPQGRPLTVREIFLHSSNVGSAMLALEAGGEAQRAFLERLGLVRPMRTEAGPVAPPQLPKHWGRAETMTIAYGHGLAVAPLQFAAAAAALINGGRRIAPTFLARDAEDAAADRVVSEATSARIREIMRLSVTHESGTGRRAEAEGYGVGGKTGTAEMPDRGGYREKAVIASFVAAFPMHAPRYLTLVSLFEPHGTAETGNRITAGVNAAPVTARLVARVAPLLGVLPRLVEIRAPAAFDAPRQAQ
jgi:cell division protein FtsI (penicillin-binding protein 3)